MSLVLPLYLPVGGSTNKAGVREEMLNSDLEKEFLIIRTEREIKTCVSLIKLTMDAESLLNNQSATQMKTYHTAISFKGNRPKLDNLTFRRTRKTRNIAHSLNVRE